MDRRALMRPGCSRGKEEDVKGSRDRPLLRDIVDVHADDQQARGWDLQAARRLHHASVPGSAPRDLHATQPASEQTSVGAARARSRRGQGPADRISGRGGSRGAGRAGERAPGGAAVPAAGRPRHRWLAGREGFFYRKGRGRICKVPESPPTVSDSATYRTYCSPLALRTRLYSRVS